ncbi:hypothetical protein OUZ56_006324 [Daphnia magna]|uniref:Uncharacterized protein n=1 Tax=Daphnia magna TaxID=35525 RepID=A0ABQ9YVD1_9CRUS|nr:hypothetical protein OUZ56_006324 [Daphnia magna]
MIGRWSLMFRMIRCDCRFRSKILSNDSQRDLLAALRCMDVKLERLLYCEASIVSKLGNLFVTQMQAS